MRSFLLLALATFAGCTTPPNPPLGTAEVTVGTSPPQPEDGVQPIVTAWAEVGYLAGDHGEYGALFIRFATDTTNPPPTCADRGLLTRNMWPDNIYIQTAQNHEAPQLHVGDIPFVSDLDTPSTPTSTYATIDSLYPYIDTGHITITAASEDRVAGTFDGTGSDIGGESNHAWGKFDVPICRD